MGWVAGTVVFFLIWWTVLFIVLPLGVQPDAEGTAPGNWRGAPRRVRVLRVVLLTTLLACVVWGGTQMLVSSEFLSFREGPWAKPND